MTERDHPLSRLAERGDVRGADALWRSAHAEAARRPPTRRAWLPAAAAVVAIVAAVGIVLALSGDDQSDVRTAGPAPEDTSAPASGDERSTSTTTPASSGLPSATAFGFTIEDGIVRLVHPGPDGETAERQPLGGVRGEEGSTHLAVAPAGDVVFHDTSSTACLTNLARTEIGGDSRVLVENAAHPALDQAGERLAHASGTECTVDADVLSVRHLPSGETASVRIGGDDGLPFRIHDVEWVGERVAVLASQYDGQEPGAQWLLLYSVPASGPPAFDDQLPLGDAGRGTLDGFAHPNIEPVPGDPGSVLRARTSSDGGTALTVLDLGTGDERVLFSIDEEMSAFAARTLEDILYVATEPKVPGSAQVDTLRRWIDGNHVMVASDVTSVAIAAP